MGPLGQVTPTKRGIHKLQLVQWSLDYLRKRIKARLLRYVEKPTLGWPKLACGFGQDPSTFLALLNCSFKKETEIWQSIQE